MRICPFCSTENEAFFRFCLGCGADLDEALGAAEDDSAGAEAAPAPPPPPAAPPVAAAPPAAAARAAAPKPFVPSKDTAVDLPAISPEVLAQAAPDKSARAAKRREPVVPASPASPPPRVAKERDKTLEPGGAVKPGSAASQAVAQAQGEARRAGPTEVVGAGPAAIAKLAARAPEEIGEDTEPDASRGEPVKTKPKAVASASYQRPSTGRSAPAGPAAPYGGAQPTMAGRPQGSAPKAPPPPPEVPTKRTGGAPEAAPKSAEIPAPVAKKGAAAKAKARLVIILEDGTDGSVLDLSPETTIIGREGVDISFPHDDFLAKRHAEFVFSDGVLYLRPLPSTNGVFLQVHQEVELDNGDVFRIGQQLLCFELLSEVAATLVPDPKGGAIPLGSPLPEGAWGRLGQLIAPDTMGSVYLLGGSEVYLGRERGDITFPGDGFVSGLHAQISMRNGRSFLKDLGSSNGTYLRLSKATPVKRGMLVLAGQQLFRVEA